MKLRLNNVRLAFPVLFEPKPNKNGVLKYSAAAIFAPDHPATEAVVEAMQTMAKDKWGEKAGQVYKGLKAQDKLCLHDGDVKSEYAGYEGNLYINANNGSRPVVLDRDRSPLTINDGRPYSGCYVNMIIDIWAQDNQHGKRVNAGLGGVQFFQDGERLAGGTTATADEFEALPMEESAGVVEEGGPEDLF